MTTYAEPSHGKPATAPMLGHLWKYAIGDWVLPAGRESLPMYEQDYVPPHDQGSIRPAVIASQYSPLDAGPFGGFEYDPQASTGLTAHFSTGEAFVGGRYVASDDDTIADADGNVLHDVDLPANESTQVYLGPDIRANEAATDRLIIGRWDDGRQDFPDRTPLLLLCEITTDNNSIERVQDRRSTEIDVQIRAQNAKQLGGTRAAKYARTDIPQYFEQAIGAGGGEPYNEIGSCPGEVFRVRNGPSDFVIQLGSGAGRVTMSYNCEYRDGEWRIIRGGIGDNCSVRTFQSNNPGGGGGAITVDAGFEVPDSANDGDLIREDDWQWSGSDRGAPYANGERGVALPNRIGGANLGSAIRGPVGAMLWWDTNDDDVRVRDSEGRIYRFQMERVN